MARDRTHILPLVADMQRILAADVLTKDHRGGLLHLTENVLFHALGLPYEETVKRLRRVLAKLGAGWLAELDSIRGYVAEIEKAEMDFRVEKTAKQN